MKKIILFLIIGIASFAACTKTESVKQVNTTGENVAIKGFDTVAYFTAENAVQGNPKYEFVWNGAKWLFTNVENLEKFKANPEQFAPQFGGYCSFAVSKGYTADGDPNAWKVVDGKLYLNYSPKVKEMWEKEQEQRIKDGEKNWKEFQSKTPQHKG
ncbi:MAG TPA: YHS domain-containing (seleno)protein [Pyrinomonadaceae bacterium]|nr:YHS domain-containing (seleno)protein [Pyrinomonadaceae bacterium]